MNSKNTLTTLLLLLSLTLIVSLQVADSSPVCPPRIQNHFIDSMKVEGFFDALRLLESDGNVCKIGENGIGPYQISKQHYDEAVDYDPELLRNGGT